MEKSILLHIQSGEKGKGFAPHKNNITNQSFTQEPICACIYNKVPQSELTIKNRGLFLYILKIRKSKMVFLALGPDQSFLVM